MKKKSKFKSKSGQSVLEYCLVFAAVIAVIIVVLGDGGVFRNAFKGVYQGSMVYNELVPG